MERRRGYLVGLTTACLLLASGVGHAQQPATASYKPTVDDWISVNAAVNNYTLGLERDDKKTFANAFWPEGVVIAQPEPGLSFQMPYAQAMGPPPPPPPGAPPPPAHNVIGTDVPPWHLALSHHFEFQSATRATHYGYFVSVYPDPKTKISTVGLPGHYEDVLEKRQGEWRILQRKTVIGAK